MLLCTAILVTLKASVKPRQRLLGQAVLMICSPALSPVWAHTAVMLRSGAVLTWVWVEAVLVNQMNFPFQFHMNSQTAQGWE